MPLSALDPQFIDAIAAAAAKVSCEWGRFPRIQFIDDAHSAAGEAVFRASLVYDPDRGPFGRLANSFVGKALLNLSSRVHQRHQLEPQRLPEFVMEEVTAPEAVKPIAPESLASLTERQRSVVVAKYESGMSFGEIGRLTGTTRQAAQRTHRRALARLSGANV